MAGSYLLYNELHYNGLMTDLGYNFPPLVPTKQLRLHLT